MSMSSMRLQKPTHFWESFRRMLGIFVPWKWRIVVATIGGGIWAATNISAPLLLGAITNTIFEGVFSRNIPAGMSKAQSVALLRESGHENIASMVDAMDIVPGQGIDFHRLGWLAVALIVLYLFGNFVNYAVGITMNRVIARGIFHLRERAEKKIHTLPLSSIDGQKRGDVMSRVTNDIDNMTTSLQQTLSSLITNILWGLGLMVMMLAVSWKLALVVMLMLPCSFLMVGLIGPRSQKAYVKQWQATGTLNGRIEESFSAHALVHAYGQKDSQMAHFRQENEEMYSASLRAQILGGLMMPIMMFTGLLTFVGVAVLGGVQVASGQLRLGTVQAFIQFSQQFNQPMNTISMSITVLQSAVASAERVFEILLSGDETPDSPDAPELVPGPGRIVFENVDFSYRENQPLIEDLNLEAKPGQTVAIVGPTGAGKTTLVNLIMRFYDIDGGRILLDGQDIAELRRKDVRGQIGMVLQDPWLFQGTIRENIRYGRADAMDEDVVAAAKATFVDRFVASLPDGYDTVIEENAANVSAGERQLITIARAFISKPAILILDEATSNVDTRTEVLVQRAMAALREGRTSFIIAHRLSTIRDADVILVMEKGRIVEQGTHEDLLGKQGAYWKLYQAQFAGLTEEDA